MKPLVKAGGFLFLARIWKREQREQIVDPLPEALAFAGQATTVIARGYLCALDAC